VSRVRPCPFVFSLAARSAPRVSWCGMRALLDLLPMFAALAAAAAIGGANTATTGMATTAATTGGGTTGSLVLEEFRTKISDTSGNFSGLANDDGFGQAVVAVPDLQGPGDVVLAVGAPSFVSGPTKGSGGGAVWILFVKSSTFSVQKKLKISTGMGNFQGVLQVGDKFGFSLAVADIDGDGFARELIVGAPWDNSYRGAIWILFLTEQGQVRAEHKISSQGGSSNANLLEFGVEFGFAVSVVVDGANETRIAVGAPYAGPNARGAVWMISLFNNGTEKSSFNVTTGFGGFGESLLDMDFFGRSVAGIGMLLLFPFSRH
jgi:FG-GAP repeat